MQPTQIMIAVTFSLVAVLLILISLWSSSSPKTAGSLSASSSGIRAFFSFQPSFSFFPPNALITIINDNTTAFLARPAAFGPSLPSEGLSGQVWIGNGFSDDAYRRELGCSDVPGWRSISINFNSKSSETKLYANRASGLTPKIQYQRRSNYDGQFPEIPLADHKSLTGSPLSSRTAPNYQTDDSLNSRLSASEVSELNKRYFTETNENHAHIQSIQEATEIAGKVVLLSRGGCGFLEKVKWSQRRGAVALIVGDDAKGGPLIQMFARSDTSGITIPSVFTSYTTARLLCSLVTSSSIKNVNSEADNNLNSNKYHNSIKLHDKSSLDQAQNSEKFKESSIPSLGKEEKSNSQLKRTPLVQETKNRGSLDLLFISSKDVNSQPERYRPPRSRELNWITVDNGKVEGELNLGRDVTRSTEHLDSTISAKAEIKEALKKNTQKAAIENNFMISDHTGQDTDNVQTSKPRVPELTEKKSKPDLESRITKQNSKLLSQKLTAGASQDKNTHFSMPDNGIITLSGGGYAFKNFEEEKEKSLVGSVAYREDNSHGVITALLDSDAKKSGPTQTKYSSTKTNERYQAENEQYEGLWVTVSPSSGANPFLDTLLVLVVSPLITLTVVYALILIRSRYRRQRWCAPKSVVKRLPVRTYQTIASSGTNSPRLPNYSNLSVTTPLLQDVSNSFSRSQFMSDISESSESFQKPRQKQNKISNSRDPDRGKLSSKKGPWKTQVRKQKECVVCLEEYIDGVSQIMALPCGHDFHVDCITPWLTMRRRTCPVCKGDVVRSLARASRDESLQDDVTDEGNNLDRGDGRITSSSSSGIPINRASRNDLELGRPVEIRHQVRAGSSTSWINLLVGNFVSIFWNARSLSQDHNR